MTLIKNSSSAALMLLLLIFLGFFAYLQLFSTPVMLPLIGKDLNLSIAQLGFIWGMSTFGGLFLSIPVGLLGDRIGPRWSIFIIAVLIAISLGARGFANDATLIAAMMFIGGGILGGIRPLATKAILTWFKPSRVGVANGVYSGFGSLGMATGAAISVTVVVVAVHGWRNTFFLYGALLLLFAILWLVIVREPQKSKDSSRVPFREAFTISIKSRDVWFCVIAVFGVVLLTTVLIGYLPIYMQNIGMNDVASSVAITLFFLSGVIGGPLLLALSDKMCLRKIFFIIPAFISIIAIASITLTKTAVQIWASTAIAGFTYGGLFPILALVIAEVKGIGARYAGTAISIAMGIGGVSGLIYGEIGGKLALINAILPFIFGTLLCLLCIIPFFFTKETGTRNQGNQQNQLRKSVIISKRF